MPPRFRLGPDEYLLVRRRDVISIRDERAARAFVEQLGDDPSALASLARSAGLSPMPGTTDADMREAIVQALTNDDLTVLRLDGPAPLGRPSRPGEDPLGPAEPVIPIAASLPIRLEVVDYSGVPYAGLVVEIDFPSGERQRIRLDKQGRWFEPHVDGPGSCRLVLPSRLRLPPKEDRPPPDPSFRKRDGDIDVPRHHARPMSLRLDASHRVVVEPPPAHPSVNFRGALFAFDSAFPTDAISQLVTHAQETSDQDDTKTIKFGLFAHADIQGDEGYNKKLADRRAEIAFSILTGDFDKFHAVAKQEPWQTDHYQALLRNLGANPGAIDGVAGEMTERAVGKFRRDYNLGLFHRQSRARVFGDLPEGATLDDATKDAILDAWHADVSGRLSPEQFHGPGFSGCGEFNPISDDDGENRRVTLAVYHEDKPDAAEFPCKTGDAAACEVDDNGRLRCRFYRERIGEEQPRELDVFYDFEWLKLPTGKAHLSALTTLPDTNDAEIVVQLAESWSPSEDDGRGDELPTVGLELARVPAMIRKGIAYGLWDYPEDWDPFDVGNWFGRPGEPEGDPWLPAYNPPAFGIRADGYWGFGGTPGHRMDRIHFIDGGPPFVVVRNDGKLVLIEDEEAASKFGPADRAMSLVLNNGEDT